MQTARRVALGAGVLLLVANMLPDSRLSLRGDQYYYWSSTNRLLAGLGAALIAVAIATKPKHEPW